MLTIFDCDGVLIDSEILAARVDCEFLQEIGFEITAEELAHRFAGFTTERIFQVIGEELGRAVPEAFIRKVEVETDRRLASEVVAIPGVHEMLDRLEGPRCICSNSRGERLKLSLGKAKLWDRFRPYVFAAREVGEGRGKPEPDVFLHAARIFEVEPGEAIVIEDSVTGVTAGVRAGMRVIGFTGASHSWPGHAEALTDAGAVTVVRRLVEIPRIIEAMHEWRPAEV